LDLNFWWQEDNAHAHAGEGTQRFLKNEQHLKLPPTCKSNNRKFHRPQRSSGLNPLDFSMRTEITKNLAPTVGQTRAEFKLNVVRTTRRVDVGVTAGCGVGATAWCGIGEGPCRAGVASGSFSSVGTSITFSGGEVMAIPAGS